ncbi:MAG: apolipoprotein N-acyltransferase [Helicobacteraceae bacterium]|nr:apolipoprotein N-acyltransferase [Helicobacteraceae bacterium]
MIKNIQPRLELLHPLVKDLLLGILTALLFSAFIYLEEFSLTSKALNTLFALSALALFLYIPRRAVLIAGFFIGLLWFYWIGYSFKYTGVGYLTPIITFGFGVIYMLFFGVLALSKKVYIRALLLFGLSFFEPMDFNWMQIELLFIESYIGIFKYQLALVLLALTLPSFITKQKLKYSPLLLLVFALDYSKVEQKDAPLNIKLFASDIAQEKKWKRENLASTLEMIFDAIQKASHDGYDLIVLPESVFPMYLNKHPKLLNVLLDYSYDISIVTGALLYEEHQSFNVSYHFEAGKYTIAKKMILVPFGEYIPLPKFAQNFINEMFFAGEADFSTAKEPSDFMIKGVKFRNAICYEATCQELYDGDVDFILALSNNAWFAPSIEPTLQNLLMRYYARKNGTTIYHSANYKGSGIIK